MRPGCGTLWPRADRTEKQPNVEGKMVCPCCNAKLRQVGWTKLAKDGTRWLSTVATEESETPKEAPVQSDDVPW